jgi:large subunit ribosomal protein L25
MEILKIEASSRTALGKGPTKRLRLTGVIPAVAYGRGSPARSLSISPKALLGALTSEHGRNSVIELTIDNKEKLTVLVREYSYHPVTREATHVDFVTVKLDEAVDVEVPFTTFGKCAGVVAGGTLRVVYRTLPIRALPEKIPVKIDHDVTNLGLNESVKASHVKLPEGVKIRLPDDQTVASVVAPEKDRSEEAAAPGAPAAAAGAKKDDKAAKPAAAAAAPAKKK